MSFVDRDHLRDLLVASDPELARLRQATRATVTAMLAATVLDLLAGALGQPTSVALIGINMAMMGSVLVNDPAPRDQKISVALVPVVASAALILGTLAAPTAWLANSLFLALVFVAVIVRRHGPRGLALGMIGFLAYFFALFFQARPANLPLMIAGIFVAAGLAYVVRFWLLRERPAALLYRRVEGLRRTIAVTLFRLARAAADGRVTPRRVAAVQRGLGVVNESALAIEELLAHSEPSPEPGAPALADQVFALELAIEVLAASVRDWLTTPASPALRAALAAALTTAREPVREPGPESEAPARRALAAARAQVGADDHAAARVLAALDGLLHAAPLHARVPRLFEVDAGPLTAPIPSLRPAVQATLAAALALVGGAMVSSERAYWAVIAAVMVFSRANTLGAMLVRAWQRVIGTVAGVIVGLLLAELVQGELYLELAIVFVCMFVAYYTLQVAYGWMVAAFTTLIAVLYSLLGKFSPELLYLRVLETLVGAGIGAGVAALVFPSYTRVAIRRSVAEGLGMLADHLERSLVPHAPGEQLASARAIDRKLRELRAEVQRASGAPSLRLTREMARLFVAFSSAVFHARPLVHAGDLTHAEPPLRSALTRLANTARSLADQLAEHSTDHAIRAAQTAAIAASDPPAPAAPINDEISPNHDGERWPVQRSLARVDEALRVLARVLAVSGLAPRDHT